MKGRVKEQTVQTLEHVTENVFHENSLITVAKNILDEIIKFVKMSTLSCFIKSTVILADYI